MRRDETELKPPRLRFADRQAFTPILTGNVWMMPYQARFRISKMGAYLYVIFDKRLKISLESIEEFKKKLLAEACARGTYDLRLFGRTMEPESQELKRILESHSKMRIPTFAIYIDAENENLSARKWLKSVELATSVHIERLSYSTFISAQPFHFVYLAQQINVHTTGWNFDLDFSEKWHTPILSVHVRFMPEEELTVAATIHRRGLWGVKFGCAEIRSRAWKASFWVRLLLDRQSEHSDALKLWKTEIVKRVLLFYDGDREEEVRNLLFVDTSRMLGTLNVEVILISCSLPAEVPSFSNRIGQPRATTNLCPSTKTLTICTRPGSAHKFHTTYTIRPPSSVGATEWTELLYSLRFIGQTSIVSEAPWPWVLVRNRVNTVMEALGEKEKEN